MSKVIRSNDELNALANGKELVTNGDFSLGTAGWLEADTNTTISNDASRLKVLNTGTTYGYGKTSLDTIVGSTYELKLDAIDGSTASYRFGVGTTTGGLDILSVGATEGGSKKFTFIATSTTTYIRVGMDTNVATSYVLFDNISVKEIPQVQGENLPDYVATRSNYGFKNHIINGGFDVWQRGTSFTGAGFTADRWLLTAPVNSQRISLSTAETDLTGAAYALRYNAGTYVSYKIEDVRTLAGKKATLSFWSRSGASKTLHNLFIRQYFGTGGSGLVDTPFSPITFNNTTGLNKHTFTVTLPTIAGKTIGSDNTHYIEIFFESQNDGIYTDITRVQLEEGSVATPFEQRPYGLELSLCQRYYQKKAIVDFTNIGGGYGTRIHLPFKTTMRISPSVTYGNDYDLSQQLAYNTSVGGVIQYVATASKSDTYMTAYVYGANHDSNDKQQSTISYTLTAEL